MTVMNRMVMMVTIMVTMRMVKMIVMLYLYLYLYFLSQVASVVSGPQGEVDLEELQANIW